MITDTTTAPASDIDQILETIEDLRESLATNLGDLKNVAGKLKQIRREQKTTEKEIQSFRQTLKTLRGVKL